MSVSSPYALFRAVDLGWPFASCLSSSPLPLRPELPTRPAVFKGPRSLRGRDAPMGAGRRAASGAESHSLGAVKPRAPRVQSQPSLVQGNLFSSPDATAEPRPRVITRVIKKELSPSPR